MSNAFALITSDSNLLGCELARLEGQVSLALTEHPPQQPIAAGVGAYADDEVLLHRFAGADAPRTLGQLAPVHPSEVLLFQASALGPGSSLDANTQPFRFRRWLFALAGAVTGFPAVRAELLGALPDYLRRHIQGETDAETAFGVFLAELRALGRIDDRRLEAEVAAAALGRTARTLKEASARSGAARASALVLLATNGRILVAARCGAQPLHYTLVEGADTCALHGLPSESTSAQQQVQAHRRRRTVVLATSVTATGGWLTLDDGHALAVDGRQQLVVARI